MSCWAKGGNYPDPPRDGNGILHRYAGGSKGGTDAILTCPAIRKGYTQMVVSHNYSQWVDYVWGEKGFGVNYAGTTTWDDDTGSFTNLHSSKIDVPSRMTYFAESLGWHVGLYQGYWNSPERSTATTPTARHFDNYDMVFCDGHVETGPLEKFYQPEYWYNPNANRK